MRTLALAVLFFSASVFAQDSKKEIEKYQQMLGEGSPAELW